MRSIIYLCIGIFFRIVLFKSEAASWFRIYEIFQFGSFHMYGIIGFSVGLGIVVSQFIKRSKIKSFYRVMEIILLSYQKTKVLKDTCGGIIFGLGWLLPVHVLVLCLCF